MHMIFITLTVYVLYTAIVYIIKARTDKSDAYPHTILKIQMQQQQITKNYFVLTEIFYTIFCLIEKRD